MWISPQLILLLLWLAVSLASDLRQSNCIPKQNQQTSVRANCETDRLTAPRLTRPKVGWNKQFRSRIWLRKIECARAVLDRRVETEQVCLRLWDCCIMSDLVSIILNSLIKIKLINNFLIWLSRISLKWSR